MRAIKTLLVALGMFLVVGFFYLTALLTIGQGHVLPAFILSVTVILVFFIWVAGEMFYLGDYLKDEEVKTDERD